MTLSVRLLQLDPGIGTTIRLNIVNSENNLKKRFDLIEKLSESKI